MSDVYKTLKFFGNNDKEWFAKVKYPVLSADVDVEIFYEGDSVNVDYINSTTIPGVILTVHGTGFILRTISGTKMAISFDRMANIRLVKRKESEYERGMNVTVRDLKDCLKDLPDDMEVIVPVFDDIDNNKISGFRHVRTIGVLESPVEPNQALCIATAVGGADMYTLTNTNHLGVKCAKGLF